MPNKLFYRKNGSETAVVYVDDQRSIKEPFNVELPTISSSGNIVALPESTLLANVRCLFDTLERISNDLIKLHKVENTLSRTPSPKLFTIFNPLGVPLKDHERRVGIQMFLGEKRLGECSNVMVDLWGLGAVIICLLKGEFPFDNSDGQAISIDSIDSLSLEKYVTNESGYINSILQKLLDTKDSYSNIEALNDLIQVTESGYGRALFLLHLRELYGNDLSAGRFKIIVDEVSHVFLVYQEFRSDPDIIKELTEETLNDFYRQLFKGTITLDGDPLPLIKHHAIFILLRKLDRKQDRYDDENEYKDRISISDMPKTSDRYGYSQFLNDCLEDHVPVEFQDIFILYLTSEYPAWFLRKVSETESVFRTRMWRYKKRVIKCVERKRKME